MRQIIKRLRKWPPNCCDYRPRVKVAVYHFHSNWRQTKIWRFSNIFSLFQIEHNRTNRSIFIHTKSRIIRLEAYNSLLKDRLNAIIKKYSNCIQSTTASTMRRPASCSNLSVKRKMFVLIFHHYF